MATATKAAKRCPVTVEEFRAGAKPLVVVLNGVQMVAYAKEFSTGSFGWSLNGKAIVDVGGVPVQVQVGLNVTAIGSKPDA